MRINLKDYRNFEIIKFIRQSTGLTQQKFANITGKSKRTIEQHEEPYVTI